MKRSSPLPPSIAPRGLSRDQAAAYIGVSPRKFDEMALDGRMPSPKRIDRRVLWDRIALDCAFDELPDRETVNEWDVDLSDVHQHEISSA